MTNKIEILACVIALLAVSPAAGFGQQLTEAPADATEDAEGCPGEVLDVLGAERSESDETELGDVGPTVTVARMLVATDVSDREPVGAASEFSIAATTHLFAFLELSNASEDQTVIVSFVDVANAKTVQTYELKVGASKRWRTWARTAAPKQPGTFAVVLTDEAGNELGSADFKMVQ